MENNLPPFWYVKVEGTLVLRHETWSWRKGLMDKSLAQKVGETEFKFPGTHEA